MRKLHIMLPRWNWRHLLLLIGMCAWLKAEAQIDPEKRRLLEFGYNQPLEGRGPIAGYAYYFLNDPGFLRTNFTLRLAVAPVYLDSELGVSQALGPNTDLGFGLAGGGFADSYSEIRQGRFFREESFTGNAAEVGLSVYHLFNPDSRIPLNGILRGSLHHSFFVRDQETAPNFVLPTDQSIFHLRTGLRWGGREPIMAPALAMEMSLWYEGQFRSDPGVYGIAGDRRIQPDSHLFWARALWAYTLPEWKHNFNVSITAGTSLNADRLSAYRLGAVLPMAGEFPLSIPGYYFQELSAERFMLLNGQYSVPLDHAQCWHVTAFASTAVVDYLPGLEQPGHWNSGVGGGFGYQSPSRAWQVMVGYGYGIDAIRSHGRGSDVIGLMCQFDLGAQPHREGPRPPMNPNKFRGLDWLLGR